MQVAMPALSGRTTPSPSTGTTRIPRSARN